MSSDSDSEIEVAGTETGNDSWTCPKCGHVNAVRESCISCGAPRLSGPADQVSVRDEAVDPRQGNIDFVAGFVGWFLVNGAIWLLIGYNHGWFSDSYGLPNLLLFPLNMILLLIFLIKRRGIGLGILGALALNLLLSLIMNLLINGACGVPFWVPPE